MNESTWNSPGPPPWPRRRMISVIAAMASLPLYPFVSRAAAPAAAERLQWRGRALGATAAITLAHPDSAALRRTLANCVGEIRRLERVFSLFEPESELCRLNRDGRLPAPSLDLRVVMAESHRISTRTGGAFDVTIQPLWSVYSEHFRRRPGDASGPSEREIEGALASVDYRLVDIAAKRIAFMRPGMAATLNGIAQGYITDRVGAILRAEGFDRVLVNTGEIAALNRPADNRPWRVAIENPTTGNAPEAPLSLVNQAVATSRGGATRFDRAGRYHHLFNPATGRSAHTHESVTVIADSAMTADALSTALAVAPLAPNAEMLRTCGAERALVVDARGKPAWIGAN